MTLSMISTFSIYYKIHFIFFSLKHTISILTILYDHVDNHILNVEEENRRRNTALAYDPKRG